jgi:hypothetical protein
MFLKNKMVLYAAKLKEKAKPVSDLPPVDKKEQAKLKRKEKALLKKQEKEKEQLELKRQEDEAKKALADKEAELKAAEEALKIKKEAQKEKRRLKRESKKPKVDESVTESNISTETSASTETTLVPEPVEPAVPEKVKKTRKRKQVSIEEQVDKAVDELPVVKKGKKKNVDEPPPWFKKYVAGVKNEESLHRSPKKPKKEIAKEANQVATEQWGNGLVRDRVRNEVDQHMSRMYQMIFNRGF